MRLLISLALAAALCAGTLDILKRPKGKYLVYVATSGKGIQAFRFDPENPVLQPIAGNDQVASPAWLAVHPGNQLIYAISDDSVSSFAVNARTGALRPMNHAPSGGTGGCHLVLDKNGWMMVATNCKSGNAVSFLMEGDGGVGKMKDNRPTGMARQVVISPDNFFIFVPDFADKIFNFRFLSTDAVFWPNDPATFAMKAGTGLRHMAFRPDERFAYAVEEKASEVAVLRYNHEAGKMTEVVETTPTLAGPTEIAVDPGGRFVYVSSRGADMLEVFAIEGRHGTLRSVQRIASGGKGTATFRIDPSGRYLLAANEASNAVSIFEIEHKTGKLSLVDRPVAVPAPVCVVFTPAAA